MEPGDLVFFHGTSLVSRAIRWAEWVRWRKGSKWNHVAVLDEVSETGWTLVQAEGRGVTRGAPLSTCQFQVVPLPEGVDRSDVLAFARAQVGSRYGFLTIFSILVTLLTPKFVNLMLPNTWICSAMAAESLRCGGWIRPFGDIYQVTPAELWEALSPPLIERAHA